MNLQTTIPIEPDKVSLSHTDTVLLLGSCFTDHIGERLQGAAFDVLRNPFGVMYNPFSIATCLQYCLENRLVDRGDLVQHQGLWHSWLHHGSFSATSDVLCLQACNSNIQRAHEYLQKCTTLVVTFGTAYVYRLRQDGRIVGNCHKVPQQQFSKAMASVDDIVREWQELISALPRQVTSIIFTVSPIRHLADGAHENQLSKAVLLLAIDRLVGHRYGHTITYFPAYELMMDELRDYRFYAEDMVHPSNVAIEIIWQRLCATYMSEHTRDIVSKAERLTRMQAHRPMVPESTEYQQYVEKLQYMQQEMAAILEKERE